MKKTFLILCMVTILAYFQGLAHASSDGKEKLKALKPKDFPTQAIEFVVVYPAGGGMDVTARILAKYVEKYIDSRCIVVNKTGGAGLVGHTYLTTQAKNDGYTVGVIASLFLEDEILRAKGKWLHKDLEPLYFINDDPRTWIVSTEGRLKDKTLKDLVKMAKENPENIKVATSSGTSSQWLAEQVEEISGAKFIKVPFQGGAPSIVSMLGGHIDVAGWFLPEYRGHLEAGKVQVIAQTGTSRSVFFPNVPTFNEVLGVNNILWTAFRWAAVPKGLSRDRFKYLEAAIEVALHDPECIKEYEKVGNKVGVPYMNSRQTFETVEKIYESHLEFFTKKGLVSK